jgi:hypothetical protein
MMNLVLVGSSCHSADIHECKMPLEFIYWR